MAATVGDFLLQRLAAWGLHRVFGYPGDDFNLRVQPARMFDDLAGFHRMRNRNQQPAGAGDVCRFHHAWRSRVAV